MRAVVMREFGPPEVLAGAEVPDPVPGPGQVLIEVEAAGITFVETQVRAGRAPNPAMLPALPAILGNGVAGWLDGSRVVSTTGGGGGGYAEAVAVGGDLPIAVPDGVSSLDALALLADGRTALGVLRRIEPRPGERVLVHAAGGGVGNLLVQLVTAAGAHAVGAASAAAKLELARRAGAVQTVDYGADGWAGGIEPVDVVIDGVGGAVGRAAIGALRDGGRLYVLGMASGEYAVPQPERGIRVAGLWDAPFTPQELRELSTLALAEAAAGRLRPTIGQTYPLERAAEAHAAIEARTTVGKTVLLTRRG